MSDCASLYIALTKAILAGNSPGYGRRGYYLASSGTAQWDDIYNAIGKALVQRQVIDDDSVAAITDSALKKMADTLRVKPSSVLTKIGGV